MKTPPVPSRRQAANTLRTMLGVCVGIMLTVTVYTFTVAIPHQDRITDNLTTAVSQEQVHASAAGIGTVAPPANSIADGKATPAPVAIVPTAKGTPRVITRTIIATQTQVNAAVRAYFTAHPIQPGQHVGDLGEQITKAVTKYLSEHPPAAGKNGTDGKPGTDGQDGAEGPSGPAGATPTQEQIAAAVLMYLPDAVNTYMLAHPAPAGPTGPVGPTGPAGAAGPSGPAGPKGDKGDGPSAQEVSDAVSDYLSKNGVPCENGTSRQDVTVLTTTGDTVTIRGCVVQAPAT